MSLPPFGGGSSARRHVEAGDGSVGAGDGLEAGNGLEAEDGWSENSFASPSPLSPFLPLSTAAASEHASTSDERRPIHLTTARWRLLRSEGTRAAAGSGIDGATSTEDATAASGGGASRGGGSGRPGEGNRASDPG